MTKETNLFLLELEFIFIQVKIILPGGLQELYKIPVMFFFTSFLDYHIISNSSDTWQSYVYRIHFSLKYVTCHDRTHWQSFLIYSNLDEEALACILSAYPLQVGNALFDNG